MNDQGETIVNLAHELLQSNFLTETSHQPQKQKNTSSLKAFLLTAFLAALGGAYTTQAIEKVRRPLTRYERVELDALVFYASRLNAAKEQDIRDAMLTRLARQNMDELTFSDFTRARDYLQSQIR